MKTYYLKKHGEDSTLTQCTSEESEISTVEEFVYKFFRMGGGDGVFIDIAESEHGPFKTYQVEYIAKTTPITDQHIQQLLVADSLPKMIS